jgi:hypothetical protein
MKEINPSRQQKAWVSTMKTSNANDSIACPIFVIVIYGCCIHKTGHMAFIFIELFIVIIHSCLRLLVERQRASIEEIPKLANTVTTENAEDVTLLGGKLWRSVTAECSEVFT